MVDKDPLKQNTKQPKGSSDFAGAVEPESAPVDATLDPKDQLIASLKAELEGLETKHQAAFAEAKAALQLQQADLDNYRKRMERELEKSKTFMLQKICEHLLPVLDSLHAASQAAEQAPDAVKQGLSMTIKLFADVLSQYGVTPIETEGQAFDPALHEAMTTMESPDVPSGQIVQVIQQGYRLHERLLRPARVIIAK
jgi:molecular chaperone GrpE